MSLVPAGAGAGRFLMRIRNRLAVRQVGTEGAETQDPGPLLDEKLSGAHESVADAYASRAYIQTDNSSIPIEWMGIADPAPLEATGAIAKQPAVDLGRQLAVDGKLHIGQLFPDRSRGLGEHPEHGVPVEIAAVRREAESRLRYHLHPRLQTIDSQASQ